MFSKISRMNHRFSGECSKHKTQDYSLLQVNLKWDTIKKNKNITEMTFMLFCINYPKMA